MALKHVVALAGGVGGAKLAHGLAQVLAPEALTVVVNTGDDFEHLGLLICPDVDTVLYNLAGVQHRQQGWGRREESFTVLEEVGRLGGPTWFRLGDRDLALHLLRRMLLGQGLSLSAVTAELARRLGVRHQVLPMSDAPVRTLIATPEGELAFQVYFVQQQCRPVMLGMRLAGLEKAEPAPGVVKAMEQADLVVVCPSNPFVSIDPILALPGMREWVRRRRTVAVSPIVGGRALKGPAAKMMAELGMEASALAVARHDADFLDGFVLDVADEAVAAEVAQLGMRVLVTDTVMRDEGDRRRLAAEVLRWAEEG